MKWNRMNWIDNILRMEWKRKWKWTWNEMCRPHLPKVRWDSSSRFSRVHILPAPSFKVLRAPQFFTTFLWNRALATVSCTFCRPHLPKVPRTLQCFEIFMWNRPLATSTVSCTFFRPHLPKVLRRPQRFTIFTWNRALATVSPTFSQPLFQKCSKCLQTELSLLSCALFVDNFCRSRPAPAKTETLLRRPQKPLYPKKQRVSRPRVFSSLNSRVPDLLRFPTTWWWRGLHDDVVDMMVRMLPMTIVRNSEVF